MGKSPAKPLSRRLWRGSGPTDAAASGSTVTELKPVKKRPAAKPLPMRSTARAGSKRKSAFAGIGSKAWVLKKISQPGAKYGGPKEYHEFCDWPRDIVTQLFEPIFVDGVRENPQLAQARLARFKNLHIKGQVVHSFFSGRLSEIAVLRGIGWALSERNEMPPSKEWLVMWSACDKSKACQAIGLRSGELGHDVGPVHYFGSIQSIMPKTGQDAIKNMRPSKEQSMEERSACFKQQRSYINQHKKCWFGREKKAGACLAHPEGQGCPMAWRDTDADERERPITSTFGGFLCTPYAPCGLRSKEGHDASESYHIFSAWDSQVKTDLLHLENSYLFEAQQAEHDFGGNRRWLRWIKLSPEDLLLHEFPPPSTLPSSSS